MDSMQLSQSGKEFSNWYTFGVQTLEVAPKQIGVYVMRKAGGQCFGRLKGESDILYIGKTTRKHGGLKHRFRSYLYGTPTTGTDKRIHDFAKKTTIEVAWCLCDEPEHFEYDLLWRYYREHDELPPLNYSTKRLLNKSFRDEGIGIEEATVTEP